MTPLWLYRQPDRSKIRGIEATYPLLNKICRAGSWLKEEWQRMGSIFRSLDYIFWKAYFMNSFADFVIESKLARSSCRKRASLPV